MKFVGCLCAAISWKLGATQTTSVVVEVNPVWLKHVLLWAGVVASFTQIVVNLVFFVLCVPFTYVVASELPEKARDSFDLHTRGNTSDLTSSLAAQA